MSFVCECLGGVEEEFQMDRKSEESLGQQAWGREGVTDCSLLGFSDRANLGGLETAEDHGLALASCSFK